MHYLPLRAIASHCILLRSGSLCFTCHTRMPTLDHTIFVDIVHPNYFRQSFSPLSLSVKLRSDKRWWMCPSLHMEQNILEGSQIHRAPKNTILCPMIMMATVANTFQEYNPKSPLMALLLRAPMGEVSGVCVLVLVARPGRSQQTHGPSFTPSDGAGHPDFLLHNCIAQALQLIRGWTVLVFIS